MGVVLTMTFRFHDVISIILSFIHIRRQRLLKKDGKLETHCKIISHCGHYLFIALKFNNVKDDAIMQ